MCYNIGYKALSAVQVSEDAIINDYQGTVSIKFMSENFSYMEQLGKMAIHKVRKVAKVRNRYNRVPHLTQDTTWESDKSTNKHHKRKPRGQPFPSRWPQDRNEQMRKHDKHKVSKGAKIRNR